MFRLVGLIAVALLALPLAGCWEFELFSWSRDGRYLVFVDPDAEKAWMWDTVKQQPARLPSIDGASIGRFTFASDREAFVFGSDLRLSTLFSPETEGLVKLNIEDGGVAGLPNGDKVGSFAVSRDGQWLATITGIGEDEDMRAVIAIAPVDDPNDRRIVAELKEDVFLFAFDNSGNQMLMVRSLSKDELPEGVDDGSELLLLTFDSEEVETKAFARTFGGYPLGARFVGSDAFVYVVETEDGSDDGTGALMLQSVEGGDPEVLHERTFAFFPPSIGPNEKTVLFTSVPGATDSWDELMHSSVQVMAIDVDSRETKTLTDEQFGAYGAKFDPSGKRIAYAVGGERFCVRVLDLESGSRQLVWRDDEERLFVSAERMMENGDNGMALATIDELFHRFPETTFRSRAAYLQMVAHLRSPLNEFDAAVQAFAEIGDKELRAQARVLLWEHTDGLVSDPADDLIREYETETSVKEFQHQTDGTRDVTDLAVRVTPERLYLRVGFNSNYDLGGSLFSDLILLFHEAGRGDSWRTVTPNVDWEYAPSRTVIVRHWYPNGQVYDLEMLDETGGTIARYTGSGFSPPAFPLFDLFDQQTEGANTIACWLDWQTIGLHPNKQYYLQAVTTKGGIESYKRYERPREEDSWDIADAFGDANTSERVDTEIAAGKRPELMGYALELQLPRKER